MLPILQEWATSRLKTDKDISNPFEVTEKKIFAVENNVDKNKYLTILFFYQHLSKISPLYTA